VEDKDKPSQAAARWAFAKERRGRFEPEPIPEGIGAAGVAVAALDGFRDVPERERIELTWP
jgi:hypothetical protein